MGMPIPPNPNKPIQQESLGTFAPPKDNVIFEDKNKGTVVTVKELTPVNTVTPSLTPDEEGKLTDAEADFILTSTLRTKHREDETVLKFIASFVRCKDIAQASHEAGVHKSIGYSYRHRKDIHNCIQKLIDKSVMKYGFDASELMEKAKEAVDFDPIEIQNPDGTFKSNLHDMSPEARRNIKKIEVFNKYNICEDINGIKRKMIVGEIIKMEFYDKQKAIELVGKEKNLFKNTSVVEHTVSSNMAELLLSAERRGEAASKQLRDVEGEVV